MGSYTRYLIPPRNWWKTWMTHVDAYPLFLPMLLGTCLVIYFGGRKLYKHPDCRTQPTKCRSEVEIDHTFDALGVEQSRDHTIWLRRFQNRLGSLLDPLGAATYFSAPMKPSVAIASWDRTSSMHQGPFTGDEIGTMTSIGPSPLQQMVNMKEVSDEELVVFAHEQESEFKAMVADLPKPSFPAQTLAHFVNNAEVLELEYQLLAKLSGSPKVSLDTDSARVSNYINKLKSLQGSTNLTFDDVMLTS